MQNTHEVDETARRSYELSVDADKAAAQGHLEHARELMSEAAALNRTYSVRARFVGSADERRVRVVTTVRRLLIPPLLDAGFSSSPGGPWTEGSVLERLDGAFTHSLLLGRQKFGGGLGVIASRSSKQSDVAYFDWRTINLRSGVLAYRTQEELEAVCSEWWELLEAHVLPWLGQGS